MNNERLIKDPFFDGFDFIDFSVVLNFLNLNRQVNGLCTQMDETDIMFDKYAWILDYCSSIGAKIDRVSNGELWYKIDLSGIAKLKKTKWDFDQITDEKYISNYDELCELVTHEDKELKASQLRDKMNDSLWKYGGLFIGSDNWSYGGFSLIDLGGGLIRYRLNINMQIDLSLVYPATPEQVELLDKIKLEVTI